jgi:hypothetical protein
MAPASQAPRDSSPSSRRTQQPAVLPPRTWCVSNHLEPVQGRGMNQKRKLVPQKIGTLDKRRRPRGLTRAIRAVIESIIFDRCTRADACKKAGISTRALYLALEKSEVAQYWRKQTDVLRTGERAANLHALIRVRDGNRNQAAICKSVQILEQMETEAIARPHGMQTAPGLVICIQAPANAIARAAPVTIDVEPGPDDAAEHQRELVPKR